MGEAPFFEKLQTFSTFWKKHHYCLTQDSIEKGIRFLTTSSQTLKTKYSRFYLTKVLNSFCVFEKNLQNTGNQTSRKSEILFRLFKSPYENSALGIVIVLKDSGIEFLPKDHLLHAILHILPGIMATPDTAYQYRDDQQGLLFIYQEIEKKRGRGFGFSDIQQLKKNLAKELEESIVSYSPSLFLIRNEEEIFRNILQLSRELNQSNDIPQLTISFQEQTSKGYLRFSVVVVHAISKNSPILKQLNLNLPHTKCFPEMTSEVGVINNLSFGFFSLILRAFYGLDFVFLLGNNTSL